MAIYQPTNITPSSLGEQGNGTVDITEGLTVTWQVNGNTPMTAFSIQIYQNNAASTPVYSTGKLTEGCPFAGKDALGNFVLFSYSIPASSLTGMANGAAYKLAITQYWGDTDSVQQNSASPFITRAKPTLTISTIPSPVASNRYTFSAVYSQAQGDALNWIRWTLAQEGNTSSPISDTGPIYSPTVLEFSHDGFASETNYVLRCRAQTESGVLADTGWQSFTVQYQTTTLAGVVTVKPEPGFSGVRVSWPTLNYIPGTAEGTPTYSGAQLTGGAPVTWDTVSGAGMEIKAPWCIRFSYNKSGKTAAKQGLILTLNLLDISLDFTYHLIENAGSPSRYGIEVTAGGNRVAVSHYASLPTAYGGTITIILTPSQLVIRRSITASASSGGGVSWGSSPVLLPEILNKEITGICQQTATARSNRAGNIKVIQGALPGLSPEETYDAMKAAGWGSGVVFATDFASKTLNAGNVDLDSTVQSLSVYRSAEGEATLSHVADVGTHQDSIIDSGVVNGKTYTWSVLGTGGPNLPTAPIVSGQLTPCFWNWTLLACSTTDDKVYTPQAIYNFKLNVDSGAVGNNNSPGILQNFTPYPTVQPSPANYASGTLTALIGGVVFGDKGPAYQDSVALRESIYALATTSYTLFLKDRKGSLRRVRTSGPISMTTLDGSPTQAQTVALPWVECGSAAGASIVVSEDDDLWAD